MNTSGEPIDDLVAAAGGRPAPAAGPPAPLSKGSSRGPSRTLGGLRLTRANAIALALILVFIVAGAVLRVEAIGGDQRVSSDEAGYAGNANRILEGAPWASFKWAPGTSLVFAVATLVSGHHSLKIEAHAHGPAQDAQLAMELATLILIAITAWMLAGPWAAVGAVGLAATYIPIVFITRTYLAEALGGLMFVAVMLAGLLTYRRLIRSSAPPPGARDRRRLALDILAVAATGVIAGLTVLSRNDLALGMVVIAVALAIAGRPGGGIAVGRLAVFAVCALAVVAPWIVYASDKEGMLVPVTTSGPDALFMGTYLPGGGEQFPVVKAFEKPVCRRLPEYCHPYLAGLAEPMFHLIELRHPDESESAAAEQEAFHNLRIYGLGHPLSFLQMLWTKFWNMWRLPWSGGNSGLHPDTSHPQHSVYAAMAWFGLLWGAFLLRRRWPWMTALLVLLVVSILNVFFVAESRDNLRMMPVLFAYGIPGLWLAIKDIWGRLAARRGRPQPDSEASRARSWEMPART